MMGRDRAGGRCRGGGHGGGVERGRRFSDSLDRGHLAQLHVEFVLVAGDETVTRRN
jgi:hypothetical protein